MTSNPGQGKGLQSSSSLARRNKTALCTLSESYSVCVLRLSENNLIPQSCPLRDGRFSSPTLSDLERAGTFTASQAHKHSSWSLIIFQTHVRLSFSLLKTFYILMRGEKTHMM